MRRAPGQVWLLLLALLVVACQAHRDRSAAPHGRSVAVDDVTNGLADNREADAGAGAPGKGFTTFGEEAAGSVVRRFADTNDDGIPDQLVTTERLLAHRGQLRVEVARPDEAISNLRSQVTAWGGHLQSQTDRTLVVRVPVQHFEEAFTWVRQAGRVLSESRQAEDVTEEFVDLGIRLDNARKARDRLLEVLQKADKVEDILKVEAELRRLTEEIERMEGRKKFLADQVALSTLSATFEAVAEAPGKKARPPSRFDWINRIGAERVMEDF